MTSRTAGVLHIAGTIGGKGKYFAPVADAAVDLAGDCPYFTEVKLNKGERVLVTKVSADQGVFACLDEAGGVWCWASKEFGPVGTSPVRLFTKGVADCSTGCNMLVTVHGDGSVMLTTQQGTTPIPTPEPIQACDSANDTALLLSTAGTLYRLTTKSPTTLTPLPTDSDKVTAFSCGSLHSAAATASGSVYTWGFNQSGCLGTGDRKVRTIDKPSKPILPKGCASIVSVGCTKGQASVAVSKGAGQEGPRTHIVDSAGVLYIAGTTHKGMGADHMHKTFMPEKDHLKFYRVGGKAPDAGRKGTPVPTGAAEDIAGTPDDAARRMGMSDVREFGKGGETRYLSQAHIVSSMPAHIHSAALSADGKLYTWGCGSNGRTGLSAFMRGPGGSKRTMKCYVSTPSAVESIERATVLSYTVGRWWTLTILDPASLPKPVRRKSSVK